MKKLGLVLITFLLTVVFVNAQPGNFDPQAMIKRQVDQLTETCSLTKDQVPKVEAIVKKYSDQRTKMFQDMQNGGGGGDFSAMREKMTKMQDDQAKEIKAILTADQAKKYDAWLKERQERMQQRMNGGGGPGM